MPEQKHSKAYHRYFENYAEKGSVDARGKTRIERVYVGQYYRVDLPDSEHRKRKAGILLFFGASSACFLFSGMTAQAGTAPIPAVLIALSLIALLLQGIAVFHRMTVPREMEIRQYRDSAERLRLFSAAAFLLLSCAAAGMAAFCLLADQYPVSTNIAGILAMVFAAVFAFLVLWTERHTPYEILPPKHERPEGSSPIRHYAPD